jgi:hypothetical protein
MKRSFFAHLSATCLFAFLGGFAAQVTLNAQPSEASSSNDTSYLVGNSRSLSILAWKTADRATQMFYDERGQSRMDLGIYNDQPMQNFYGDDGKIRLQIGTYPGTYTGVSQAGPATSERGMPMMGFSDNSGNLKMLFRLAGGNQSPVIIMKDNQHRDRIVMGLALNDGKQEPFLATYDNDGNKKMIFGDF